MGSWIQCHSGSQFSRHQLGVLEFNSILSWLRGKESTCQCRRLKRQGFDPWVGKTPWNKKWQPAPGFLPGKSYGQRSLVGYSPWGCGRVRHNWMTKQQQQSWPHHLRKASFTNTIILEVKISTYEFYGGGHIQTIAKSYKLSEEKKLAGGRNWP